MLVAPTHSPPSILLQLVPRDEWREVMKLLSLEDLGRLRSTSVAFRDAVPLGAIERAALRFIRQREGDQVSVEDLRHFRFHPAVRAWADAGQYAAACVASLFHIRKEVAQGNIDIRHSDIALPEGRLQLDVMAQTRDGRAVVVHVRPGESPTRYLVGAGQVVSLQLPDGLVPYPSIMNLGGIHASRSFLSPRPDWWVLEGPSNGCHFYHAGTRERTALPLLATASPHMAAVSANGRFVAVAACGRQRDGLVQCFDRDQNRISMHTQIPDRLLCQLSVANDGRVFAGAQQRGYLLRPDAEPVLYPFEHMLNSLFRLSPDERFLIRSGMHSGCECGDIVLEDTGTGKQRVLPRMTSLRPNGCATYPAGIAFSPLNALAAVVYYDGVIAVFDLHGEDMCRAQILAEADFPWPGGLVQPQICFDGFDRVHTVLLGVGDTTLGRHTLFLGQHGSG